MQHGSGNHLLESRGQQQSQQRRHQQHHDSDQRIASQPRVQPVEVRTDVDRSDVLTIERNVAEHAEEVTTRHDRAVDARLFRPRISPLGPEHVCGERAAVLPEDAGRDHMGLGLERRKGLVRGIGIVEGQRRSTVRADDVGQHGEAGGHRSAIGQLLVKQKRAAGDEQRDHARRHHDERQLGADR